MRDHIRWGASFWAAMAEFTTDQIDELREHCKKLIDEARALDRANYRIGAIPFDNEEGYEFLLQRVETHLWSLEVVQFPPHASKGVRVRAARREREKRERKEKMVAARPQRARRPRRTTLKRLLIVSYKRTVRSEFGHNLPKKLSPAVVAVSHALSTHCRSVISEMNALLSVTEESMAELLRRTLRYVENCEREGRIDTTPELSSGMRLERRVFIVGPLQIPLNTWAPIDPGFDQIWDISLFGVRLVESERI